jgi:hypothetical protein
MLALLAVPVSALAAPGGLVKEGVGAPDAIGGLVVNQTISPNGYEFFRIFSEVWRTRPDSENYTISIQEMPSKRHGNSVAIFFKQVRVFSGYIPIKYAAIRPLCEQAVDTVLANLITLMLENSPRESPDIAKDDI